MPPPCRYWKPPKKLVPAYWIVSEYGHVPVTQPILPQSALRKAESLTVRPGPFGEIPDLFNCRAFAVRDHQPATTPDDLMPQHRQQDVT